MGNKKITMLPPLYQEDISKLQFSDKVTCNSFFDVIQSFYWGSSKKGSYFWPTCASLIGNHERFNKL